MPLALKRLTNRPAIDDQCFSGDIAPRVAGEQERRTDQFLRVAPAVQRGPRCELLLLFGSEHALGQISQERSWSQAVHGDVVSRQVEGLGSGHPH